MSEAEFMMLNIKDRIQFIEARSGYEPPKW